MLYRLSNILVVLALCCAASLSNPCLADESGQAQLRQELEQAKQEIRELRNEMAELRQATVSRNADAELRQVLTDTTPVSDDTGKGIFDIPTGWRVKPYGYFKGDVSYDESAVAGAGGDYVVWALSDDDGAAADDDFNFTARQSRLGTKIFAPDFGDVEVMARAEIDFYSGVTPQENQGTVLLRHAYGQMTGNDWQFLFGQTSDVISPLNPTTLNYTVGWFAGNIGYRHPQLRYSKWWDAPDGDRWKVETALSRHARGANTLGVANGRQDAPYPSVLARASYATPFLAERKLEAGVSGHWGKEEIDFDAPGDNEEVASYSLNFDLVVPLTEQLELKGELFCGKDLDTYFGGIGQGVNADTREGVNSRGGWCQVAYRPCQAWLFDVGAGVDDPQNSDLRVGDRSRNGFIFGNAIYQFTEYLSTGVEVSYWRTDYKNSDDGDAFRIQHSWQFSF